MIMRFFSDTFPSCFSFSVVSILLLDTAIFSALQLISQLFS